MFIQCLLNLRANIMRFSTQNIVGWYETDWSFVTSSIHMIMVIQVDRKTLNK